MVALLHGFPVCSCEWNRFESHRLPQSCARILRIERGNADPLGNGSASADIYNLMPARLSPSRHLQIGRSKAGLGLFARVAIKKGQFIVRYSGRKITTEVADQLDTRYLFEVNSRWTIDGASRRNRARYINHSCRPNAEVYFVKHVIKIRAIKNIKPGDEITYHYGRDYFDSFIKAVGCRCKACAKKRAQKRAEMRLRSARRKARRHR
jgi:SET domain-containing protein